MVSRAFDSVGEASVFCETGKLSLVSVLEMFCARRARRHFSAYPFDLSPARNAGRRAVESIVSENVLIYLHNFRFQN